MRYQRQPLQVHTDLLRSHEPKLWHANDSAPRASSGGARKRKQQQSGGALAGRDGHGGSPAKSAI